MAKTFVPFATPINISPESPCYRIAHPEDVRAVNDGAVVGDIYLSSEVINDMADKIMDKSKNGSSDELIFANPEEADRLMVPVSEIKFIPPFPENCPIDPKHHATGPAMDLTGEIKNVDVYRKADDEDIAVVPNGIIHDGEFISISQIGEAAMVGASLCKLYKQETGNLLKDSF